MGTSKKMKKRKSTVHTASPITPPRGREELIYAGSTESQNVLFVRKTEGVFEVNSQ